MYVESTINIVDLVSQSVSQSDTISVLKESQGWLGVVVNGFF